MKQDFQDRIELRRTGVTFESSRQRAKASGIRLRNEDNLLVFAVITDPDAS